MYVQVVILLPHEAELKVHALTSIRRDTCDDGQPVDVQQYDNYTHKTSN